MKKLFIFALLLTACHKPHNQWVCGEVTTKGLTKDAYLIVVEDEQRNVYHYTTFDAQQYADTKIGDQFCLTVYK